MSNTIVENFCDAEEELEEVPTGADVPNCFCRKPARMLVSWTDRNPGRRFFRCAGSEGSRCRFFHWHNERYSHHIYDMLNKMKWESEELRMENFRLKFLYDQAKAGEVEIKERENVLLKNQLNSATEAGAKNKELLKGAQQQIKKHLETLRAGDQEVLMLKGELKAVTRASNEANKGFFTYCDGGFICCIAVCYSI